MKIPLCWFVVISICGRISVAHDLPASSFSHALNDSVKAPRSAAQRQPQTISFFEQGTIQTIAGPDSLARQLNGERVTFLSASNPQGLCMDRDGNLYVADFDNEMVFRIPVKSRGASVVAGTGLSGFSGDGRAATEAQLHGPTGVALDDRGDLYIADSFNNRIRKVDMRSGIITTYAGSDSVPGFGGDGGPALKARLSWPRGIAFDADNNLYIADNNNHRIRKVTPAGTISTVAGTGRLGYNGDGKKATLATLYFPSGVAVDQSGNLYVADNRNRRVRKIDVSGRISTFAGTGRTGGDGDGRAADHADMLPTGIHVDAHGNVYIADESNNAIRKIAALTGLVTTAAGAGYDEPGFSGDFDVATASRLKGPVALTTDGNGNLYFSDAGNGRIRAIHFDHLPVRSCGDPPFEAAATSSSGLKVMFSSSNDHVARVKGNIISLVGEGRARITAYQEGNALFEAAPEVSKNLLVGPPEPDHQAEQVKDALMTLLGSPAYAGIIIVCSGAIAALVLLRRVRRHKLTNRQIQTRLRSEKEKIAQDLHDNIGSHLTSINFGLAQLSKEPGLPVEKLQALNENINATILELRNTIWAIHKDQVSLEELIDKISNLFWRLSQTSGTINFEIVRPVEHSPLAFNPTEAVNLFRVIQEAVNNSLKHSGADRIAVSLESQKEALAITIRDNGAGFDLDEVQARDHFGLDSMRKRSFEINAEITIRSEPGGGTRIVLTIPAR